MAASCMLVTNPSMSGPTLMLHNIDSSNGTVPLKGDFLKILGPKRGAAHFEVAFTLEGWLIFVTFGSDLRKRSRCLPRCGVVGQKETTPTARPWDVFIPGLGGLVAAPLCPFIRTECWCQHCRSLPPPPLPSPPSCTFAFICRFF